MNNHLSHMRNTPYLPSQQSAPHAFNLSRVRVHNMTDEGPPGPGPPNGRPEGADAATEEAPRVITFRNLFLQSEANLNRLFQPSEPLSEAATPQNQSGDHPTSEKTAKSIPPSKKPTRAIDEDDYGDEEDEDDDGPIIESPLLQKVAIASAARGNASPASTIPGKPPLVQRTSTASDPSKTSDDARKQLQHDKQAAEEAAKLDFHNMFYTLEHDQVAMLEQQKIDELDRQVEAEVSGDQRNKTSNATTSGTQQGSLSSANLGASSLMLKHLLARIDSKRSMVKAQDWQLRKLIGEVRKNRSKWASEDKIGQEELYEAAEKVLQELKALTEHSGPFLNRVNKRDAPDYYNIIKHPMDIGTMMKKLKNIAYKSKKEFVDDLNLIWNNCLRYNTDPNHFLRKKALIMQKHTESLVFLIPDIVVRDRAEVEAEERRMQHLDAELDGMEDSDDEPIMASRGRKAPSKVAKKGNNTTRKAPPTINEGTPGADSKPLASMSSSTNLRNNFLRADSDAPMEGIVNGFSTPPPGGNLTPYGPNGVFNSGAPASQADASDMEGLSVNEIAQSEESELVDLEFRTWKQVTKKARAVAAAERNRLFVNHRLNPEEPALLRSKAGMRRFARLQKKLSQPQSGARNSTATTSHMRKDSTPEVPGETLAEGVEAAEDDNLLPDYYDPVSAIPDIDERLRWDEDEDGHVFNHAEECLRVVPNGHFTAPDSTLAKKMHANMRQMQETRRVCAKIGIVKQMQMQMQLYQNQFPKYDPQPLVEADIATHVVSDDGPIMADEVCRAAFQRTIGKIFYHTGFEDFQPSALDAATDLAAEYFQKLTRTFMHYKEAPKIKSATEIIEERGEALGYQKRYSLEEALLHTLNENSMDIESLEGFVKDDVERLGQKLGVMHERMKGHLADLLRPALDPAAGADGVGAFNDNSDQFIGGDFAEDIGEDFFGFKELGLDREYGLATLSVPFHLLKNRMYHAHQSQMNNSTAALTGDVMKTLPPVDPITIDSIANEIGLVQEFFLGKLHKNNDEPLIEDDELPPKQRFPKPRLPPTGKISSPRKRPLKEQQQLAKKKRKLEEGRELIITQDRPPIGKLKLDHPQPTGPVAEPEKEEDATGMMSPPESL